ncbi:hypothetical protein TNCV_1727921 [Trichonephila clavipes]|nr:hypothetical protein TNCV_1727921 [Trichonephila clavipes]
MTLAKAVHNSIRFVDALFTPCSKTSQRGSVKFKFGALGGQFMTHISQMNSHSTRPGLVRGTVVLLENFITVRITEQHKWMEVINQQFHVPKCINRGWYTHQRSQTVPPKKNELYSSRI